MALLLTPRSDWLDDRRFVYSVSVENVRKADFLEADPAWFFDNTYPSEDMRRLLHRYVEAARQERNLVATVIGGYGTGKSHLLSLVYHAAMNLPDSQAWLGQWAAKFPLLGDLGLPDLDVQPLIFSTKSQGGRHRFLWNAMFSEPVAGSTGAQALKIIQEQTEAGRSPDKETIQRALDAFGQGRYLLLLLDELDAWVGELEAAKTANTYFVEKLAEIFSQGMVKGALLLSLRGVDRSLLEAVQRSGAELFRPGQAMDRTTIIRFRLFGEPDDEKRSQIIGLAARYVETYRRALDRFNQDETLRELHRDNGDDLRTYAERIVESYPFHPAMLWALLRKYDALYESSKEGLRGPMFILRSLLQSLSDDESRDLILAGDLDYKTVSRYLYEEKIQTRCQDDHRRFDAFRYEERPKHYRQLLNMAFLYSLPEDTYPVGATRSQIIYGLVRPVSQLHDICNDVSLFLKLSLYVSVADGQMRLNLDRKVEVEVDDRAREFDQDPDVALRRLAVLMKQMAGVSETSHEAILLEDPDVPAVLSGKTFRVAYSLKRESEQSALSKRLYTWLGRVDAQYRNLTVFVVPEMGCNLTDDRDFLWLAQQLKAAEEVALEYQGHAQTTSGDTKRDYLRRADTARTIGQRALGKIRQVLTEDTRWYLATFHEYDQALQGYTIYPEFLNLDKGHFPQRLIIKNRLADKARGSNYALVRPQIKELLRQFVHTPQVNGLTIEDHFHASLGMPVLPDEGLILAAALVEMGADREIYYKAGGKVYHGSRPATLPALSAITEVSLQPILDLPAVHIPPVVEPTTPIILTGREMGEATGVGPSIPGTTPVVSTVPTLPQVQSVVDRPAKVIFELEERANAGPLSVQRATLTIRLDGPQPLAQLAPSGLPQVTVPGTTLSIELDLAGLPWDQVSTILNSLSSITELRSPRLTPGDKGKTLTVEYMA